MKAHQDGGILTADLDGHVSHHKDDEEQIAKYRELLQSIQEKEKRHRETDMEMEIKWVPVMLITKVLLPVKLLKAKEQTSKTGIG
uniref:Uncharacterized protein n=1 Tax=Sphaerodactylus townsendi TaxID=933632 RepID=A0ACB8GFI1_9SAUR